MLYTPDTEDATCCELDYEFEILEARRIADMFEAYSDDFLTFRQVLEPSDIPASDVCAFMFLCNKFGDKYSRILDGADHEQIWLSIAFNDIRTLTDKEIQFLSRCGISFDEENQSLYVFT